MTEMRLQPGDSERIAAFLDQKLSDRERRDFMDRLDRDEALYEVFVETVRYREAAAAGGSVIDHPARFRRARWALPSSIAAPRARTRAGIESRAREQLAAGHGFALGRWAETGRRRGRSPVRAPARP